MPLVFQERMVRFVGLCLVEDALPLIEHLRQDDRAELDLSECTFMHTALLQLLLEMRPKTFSAPTDPMLARWIVPLLVARWIAPPPDEDTAALPSAEASCQGPDETLDETLEPAALSKNGGFE